MHNLTQILKPFLTVALIAMVMAAQFVAPMAEEYQAEAMELSADDSADERSESTPEAVLMQANDLQAIVPFVKLQLETAYFLMRQLAITVLDTTPVPLPLPQYKDVWSAVVFCTSISSQAP